MGVDYDLQEEITPTLLANIQLIKVYWVYTTVFLSRPLICRFNTIIA